MIINFLNQHFMEIMGLIITIVTTLVGKTYRKYINTKTKKDIINATVQYIEQISKSIETTNDEKKNLALTKAYEWLKSAGIKVSVTELEILVEAAVNNLKKEVK